MRWYFGFFFVSGFCSILYELVGLNRVGRPGEVDVADDQGLGVDLAIDGGGAFLAN